MKRRLVWVVALLVLCAAVSVAWAMAGEHGSEPVGGNSAWIPGIKELANRPERFGGYWVNAQDVFFYKGDTQACNAFLAQYARLESTDLVVTLHVGKRDSTAPWTAKAVEANPDWTLYASPKSWSMFRDDPQAPAFLARVDVWLDGGVRLQDLVVPSNVTLKSGGEIERFIAEHAKKAAGGT